MVKIYTKKGDKGKTTLYNGDKCNKGDQIIDCLGTIDEVNAWIGKVRLYIKDNLLEEIQQYLFTIGSVIAKIEIDFSSDVMVSKVEKEIDRLTEELPKLTRFIIPGGNECCSNLHVLRTVCRRAERQLCKLEITDELYEKKIEHCIKFMNRLSDYIFMLAYGETEKTGTIYV